jgi:arylsulfatase A-like enzyme
MKEYSTSRRFGIFSLLVLGSVVVENTYGQNKLPEAIINEYQKLYGSPASPILNKTGLNFLLITDDQHHWMAMGYNDPNIKTPNLDRLAKMGVIFDRAYCPNPTCTPSRATLITGMMPSQHDAYALGTKLPESIPTVGDEFISGGYETCLIGKAHFQPMGGDAEFPSLESSKAIRDLDFWEKFSGPFYGFNHVELARNHGDEASVGQDYLIWIKEKLAREGKDTDSWRAWFRKPTGTANAQYGEWKMPKEYHMNTWISERTVAQLTEYAKNNKPFFLWASFFDPHPPYLVPAPWDTMYDPKKMEVPEYIEGDLDDMPPVYQKTQEENPDFSEFKDSDLWSAGLHSHLRRTMEEKAKDIALYYGMISFVDQEIGKILNKLDELGLTDKTVIVFSTDHGNVFGQHGLKNKGPFLFEDLVKLPFIVSCPGQVNKGQRSDALQSLLDVPETFLSLAGLPIPKIMSGIDQKEVWLGNLKEIRDNVIVENHQQPFSLYQKQLITPRYKITSYMNHEYGELFDLEKDPGERHNLWNDPDYSLIKTQLLLKLIQSEMKKESVLMLRISGA